MSKKIQRHSTPYERELRDQFAGWYLCGAAANPDADVYVLKTREVAAKAYELADAMLRERAKG